MSEPKRTPAPTQRKRGHAPGHILATYCCYRCRNPWQVTYPAPWAMLDPMFRRDVCPKCHAGAGIMMGYTSCLPLAPEPVQLGLGLGDVQVCTTASMRLSNQPCWDVSCPVCDKVAVL